MTIGFDATQLSVSEGSGVLVIVLSAPSTDDEDFYLMLQRKDTDTEQDRAFGTDKPYLEYCGQGWSWYGHIEGFELMRDRVFVRMDAVAASRMQNDGSLEVGFQFDEAQFERLRVALERTFRDAAYYIARV
jgi:Immunity protein 10